MTRIFDNIKFNLGTHLQQSLEVSDRMDVAVGYFNLRGWGAFDSLVREKVAAGATGPVVRILIGMVMTGPQQKRWKIYRPGSTAHLGRTLTRTRPVNAKRSCSNSYAHS